MRKHRKMIGSLIVLAVMIAPLSIMPSVAQAAPTAGNVMAVCGCGKVFTPDENTKYITYEEHTYACCSDKCHEMATKNAAMVAGAAKEKCESVMAVATTPVSVANLVEVTEHGANALCGCGMKVAIGDNTKYFKVGDKSYAVCSDGCKTKCDKAPAESAKMIQAKIMESKEVAKK